MRFVAALLFTLWVTLPVIAQESIRAKLLGFETYIVCGANMEPTIHRDELVYVETKSFGPAGPARGHIVAYRSEKLGGAILVMRVVAIVGDSIEVRDGHLFVNESRVEEPYVDPKRAQQPYSKNFSKKLVSPGTAFALGDFRDNSNDSRFLGPVPLTAIVGRVTMAKESWLTGEFREVH
jgi:signal peptidase I